MIYYHLHKKIFLVINKHYRRVIFYYIYKYYNNVTLPKQLIKQV